MATFRRGPPNWAKIAIFDQYLAYWHSGECCQQILMVECADNMQHRTPFVVADSCPETQPISESSHD